MQEETGVSTVLLAPLGAIRQALAQMEGEVAYIRNEFPRFAGAPEVASMLEAACNELTGTLLEALSEWHTLCDKLESSDPAGEFVNPDPRVNIGFITEWLGESLVRYDQSVSAMVGRGDEPLSKLASMLLMNCGTNLLASYTSILDARAAIEQGLTVDGEAS